MDIRHLERLVVNLNKRPMDRPRMSGGLRAVLSDIEFQALHGNRQSLRRPRRRTAKSDDGHCI